MVVGFNHNFQYKGVLYHIQTEDGGLRNPVIITHLFDGGTILATKKTSYADIIRTEHLEQVVEELMKDQHREMLRRLRKGDFDPVIERLAAASAAPAAEAAARPQPSPLSPVAPVIPPAAPAPAAAAVPPLPPAPPADLADRILEKSLDDIILSYLLGEDKSG